MKSIAKRTRHFAIPSLGVLAVFVVTSCNPNGDTTPKLYSTAYYPLAKGSHWVFQGPDHLRTMRVVKHEQIDGVPCALVRTLRDDKVIAEEHVTVKENGVFAVSINGDKLPAAYPLLRLPPRQGRTWRVNITKEGMRSQDVYNITHEQVETPVGKFSAVVLRGQKFEAGKRKMVMTRWFAKDVGIVKEKITIGGKVQVYELVKYAIEK